ncbi:prolyl oligopeptidase family serine peptidase [Guptibacillus hwajinpoensis]|uniref:Esterase n=1 Tax=Guptibacillus hwajinpoensis TaxID=208199 RepID=A0A0J6CRI9_9BACL|nr:prolyl oligopeptidase family serine peptidase [Alkalihalobacillus macyae]KMM38921.1 esterase [Alkalihalobacillus macyae]
MITIENQTIQHIPVLHVVEADLANQKLPLVMFQHGFTSAKEHNLHIAYLLAEEGYRVLLPDAVHHGEREKDLSGQKRQHVFWEIVIQSLTELDQLRQHFVDKQLVQEDRIGMSGTSMGGILTFGALTQYPWIKTAVSLMGSPSYFKLANAQIRYLKEEGFSLPISEEEMKQQIEGLQSYDLSLQEDKLDGRPLMMWHSTVDKVVPYTLTYDFYNQIKPSYEGREQNLKFMKDETSGHKVSREAVLALVEWFKTHL